jgi:hypothetical protein
MKQVGFVAVLSAMATFVNPYGYKLHVHVYQYLSNRFLMDHIDEFLSPNFHGIAQQCFAVLLSLTVLALAVRQERISPFHLLVVLFAAYSGLYASRNLPVSSLLLTLVISPLLAQGIAAGAGSTQLLPWLRRLFQRSVSFASRTSTMEARLRGHLWPVLAAVVLLWACMHGGRLGPNQLMSARFSSKRFPVQAAEVIVKRNIRGPIFCPDNWGGYLIYRLYPNPKVMVDDRHDLYGEQFFKDYLKLVRVEPGWDRVLNERAVNWALLPVGSTLSNALQATPGWSINYRDETAVLFQRKIP